MATEWCDAVSNDIRNFVHFNLSNSKRVLVDQNHNIQESHAENVYSDLYVKVFVNSGYRLPMPPICSRTKSEKMLILSRIRKGNSYINIFQTIS